VRAPGANPIAAGTDLPLIRRGQTIIGFSEPLTALKEAAELAERGANLLAMELMPRITRAQSMDALSSMATIAGYKGVLLAAVTLPRMFPMLMTAAGTISPARVFIVGAGVAGLQAIATAKRLGAVIEASDVRPAVKEQIESLGAKAVFVEDVPGIEGEGSGGYATEMSEDYKARQAELVSSHITKQDIVITTALIPGRPAPRLISDAQVASMRPGGVIVDLAVEQGGNVEGAVAGEVVERHGIRIVGHRNVPSRLAADASALYARNLYNFLSAFWDKEAGRVLLPDDDEIVKAIRLTKDGKMVNERLSS
jgi:NAD(P) transhydrogenase subunit alpha